MILLFITQKLVHGAQCNLCTTYDFYLWDNFKDKIYRMNTHMEEELKENIQTGILNVSWQISTYLNDTESVCLYRDSVFSTFYNTGKFILLFLWSDT
jgi:hypothetical protein